MCSEESLQKMSTVSLSILTWLELEYFNRREENNEFKSEPGHTKSEELFFLVRKILFHFNDRCGVSKLIIYLDIVVYITF